MKTTTTYLLLLLLFCTNLFSQEINIIGNLVSIPDNDITPITTDFTDFATLNSRVFKIQNTAAINLSIGAITITGANASEFTITSLPATTIGGGFSTNFTVTFNPTATGIRNATISIVNNDSNENPYDFAIQGTGVAKEINVLGNTLSILSGDVTPVTTDWTVFGTIDVNSGTIFRTFTIQNTGTMMLTIGAITFTGANASDFKVISNPSIYLLGNAITTFDVRYIPSTIGTKTATISITNDDSNENPYTFSIQGTGVNPTMSIFGGLSGTNNVADGNTTTSISNYTDFQSTNVNSSIYRTFLIKNLGSVAINLTGTPVVSITGSSDFVISTQAISPVPVTGSRSFIVTFTPTSVGIKTATISISNNDIGINKNPYTFVISGEGIQKFLDTDNDGIFDHLDGDDDNDGIPDVREQSFVSGNSTPMTTDLILLNETFGTSTTRARINVNIPTATTDYCYEDGTAAQAIDECDTDYSLNDGNYSVSNTAQCASWAAQYWYTGLDHTASDTNGRMGLFNATISTTAEFYRTVVQGVILGAPVTYSFWALNLDRVDAPGIATRPRPQLEVDFFDLNNNIIPGSKIITGDVPPSSLSSNQASDWHFYTITFTPTTTNGFSIVFRNKQIGGGGNDLALDDIIVKQTLADSDADGGADIFDLDSDNDGIGGIIEDGWKALSNGKDTMNMTAGIWLDTNNNGWHDITESYYSTNAQRDFDGDSVPNYVDLDSDNDANFDVDEAGIYNGDGDINCDGAGEGNDPDKDGILSKFDTYSGFANGIKPQPQNTLFSVNEDYLNISSKVTGIKDISLTLYASLDNNNDGIIDGTIDLDKDGIIDAFDTNNNYFGSPRDLNRKLFLDFDGRNDFGQATSILGGLPQATIMAWIDWNNDTFLPFTNEGIIAGQDKFNIKLNASKNIVATVNGTSLVYSALALHPKQWYHVAAVYGNGSLKLYLNGTMVNAVSVTGTIASDASLLTIGKNPILDDNYFKGKIDELRIFNVALSDQQLQRMVYQEVSNFAGEVRGDIIPKNIETLPFANLIRYYKMDVYKSDIIDDLSTPATDVLTGMKIYNNKNIYRQEAPLPFETERTGDFQTAVNSPTRDIKGKDIADYDWSIVLVKHDITETANMVDLGMIVDSNMTINMINDTKLQNDWYLRLNGKIDLQDKSQLVQTINSDLDVTSSGSIERDQKGHANIFNYNYWSSPVGLSNSTTNNNSFTVASVMKDGTNPNSIQNINWTTGYNGSPTTPITLSSYWIYKFQNLSNSYSNWAHVGQNGTLNAAQGFTLKGSGSATNQNYTFIGKPNNGTITGSILPNNLILAGNPYPSSIDANAFIIANTTSTTGTIYFWEHYTTNTTHVLADYQGGYGTRNLVGGVAPVAPSLVSGLGSSARVPQRYIPVGQGFFIVGSTTGGNYNFNNNTRQFVKEDDPNSNLMFKNNSLPTVENSQIVITNSNDIITNDNFKKVRLGSDSKENYHRQLLLGFMDNNATSTINSGYDAVLLEVKPSDIYFLNSGLKLNIQGEGHFNVNNTYPIGVKANATGEIKFTIDAIENFNNNHHFYIFDNSNNSYHEITNQPYIVEVQQGITENRFSLTFKNNSRVQSAFLDLMVESSEVKFAYNKTSSIASIENYTTSKVEKVLIYTIIGQYLNSYDVSNSNLNTIEFPINTLSTGTYIVKIINNDGTENNKKIIVN